LRPCVTGNGNNPTTYMSHATIGEREGSTGANMKAGTLKNICFSAQDTSAECTGLWKIGYPNSNSGDLTSDWVMMDFDGSKEYVITMFHVCGPDYFVRYTVPASSALEVYRTADRDDTAAAPLRGRAPAANANVLLEANTWYDIIAVEVAVWVEPCGCDCAKNVGFNLDRTNPDSKCPEAAK